MRRGTADKGELKVGGKVKVHSLKKADEHNGKHGVLLGYDGEAGRWGVQLDGGGDVSVRVRAGNLTSLTGIEDKCPEGLYGVVRLSLSKVRESEDGHGEAAGQAAVKMAMMDAEGIPLELLSSTERQGVSLLTQHALVRVDGKGLGAMHALTQAAVREQLYHDPARPLSASIRPGVSARMRSLRSTCTRRRASQMCHEGPARMATYQCVQRVQASLMRTCRWRGKHSCEL